MKFVLTNDVHLYKGPASRLDDYESTAFAKLGQVSSLAIKIGAQAVLVAGDLFHLKAKASFATVLRLYDWAMDLRGHGVEVLAIAGNHDLQHDRPDSLATQPLGLLFRTGALTNVAYLAQRYGNVCISGIPYPDAMDLPNYAKLPTGPWQHSILMAHCFATVEGGEYYGVPIHCYADFASLPFEVVHLGHDHQDHSVVQIGKQFFVNIGALTRGALSDDEITRQVKVAVVTFEGETTTVQQVRLQIAPASEVFDLQLHQQQRQERQEIEQFVADLAGRLDASGPVDLEARLGGMGLDGAVRDRVLLYLSAAEQEPD